MDSDCEKDLVSQYLLEWGIGNETVKNFEDNDITFKLLEDIQESELKELIPSIKERILFKRGLEKLKTIIHDTASEDTCSVRSSSDILCSSPSSSNSLSSVDQRTTEICHERNDLKTILKMTSYGELCLASINKNIDTTIRNNITKTVVEYYSYIQKFGTMTSRDFDDMSSQITILFPSECKVFNNFVSLEVEVSESRSLQRMHVQSAETYYVPSRKYSKKSYIPARGKLVDRYHNQKRILRKASLISAPHQAVDKSDTEGTCKASANKDGYEYVREVDAWLRLHIVPASWADAGMRCYLEGGILASPTTPAMSAVMQAMMAQQQLSRCVFTGINSILVRDYFTSLEGVPLANMSLGWAAGEPDNSNLDERCLALTGAGALADVSCESALPYFCRRENKCGTKAKGYDWKPRTGSCYKFHRAAKPWRLALATCHEEGGHLAIINSETEFNVLAELYSNNPKETITGAQEDRHAFIGFMKWYDGEWATIFGTKLAEAGFERWDQKEPSNGSGVRDESCGSIHRNGLLNDAPCDQICPFICEITP